MSSKSNKRKITVEKSGQRPSVFERLGTKAEQRDHSGSSSGFCRHWNNTGNCPFGSSCKNAMHHILISPSKQRAASKDKEHTNLRSTTKSQSSSSSRSSLSRLLSTVVPQKESAGTPPQTGASHIGEPGAAGGPWEEEWNERSLEHADEKELERRRQQLQRELELQMKKEMRRRKLSASGGSSTAKKASRSSSSSSSSSSGSSSSSSGSSSDGSSSSRGRRAGSKSRSSKQQGRSGKRDSIKPSRIADAKKPREMTKESIKKRSTASSSIRSNSRGRQRTQQTAIPTKRRRESSSADSSGSDRRKQSRANSGQHHISGSRIRGRSPSPERKPQQERKRPAISHEKVIKRREVSPPPRKSSIPPSRGGGGALRKRSVTPPPRPRRRSPSPQVSRGRVAKRHGSNSRNTSPVVPRRQSPPVERKDSRRGHTPPSPPPDRSYNQRSGGGRNSRRSSPEAPNRSQQNRDVRQRAMPVRDARQSPDRRPPPPLRATSREPVESKRADWGRGREYGTSPPPPRVHHRSSPDSSNGSTSRREIRGDKARVKDHDRDRDRRREPALPLDKGRDKIRGRAEEGELPSLLSLMTQHPGHFPPQPQSSRPRPLPREEPPMEHRGAVRDRGRFERFDSDRGGDSYSDHGEEHHRSAGGNKRGPPPRRELSPPLRQQRPPKSREWGEFSDRGGRDWERRPGTKGSGGNAPSAPLRQWGPVPGSEDQPRQNRMLPPLSVRNAMQAARRGGAVSPSGPAPLQSASSSSPPTVIDSTLKVSSELAQKEKSSDEEEILQKGLEPETEHPKELPSKRPLEVTPEEEEMEPSRKRQCTEELPQELSPTATPQPVTSSAGLDLMESDLSDISDDADDILNAEGAEETGELDGEEKGDLQGTGVCEEDEEEEPVEDILDMDFEEISDGELEAEEARGGIDALTVDWAALMSQTRSREGEETREARTHRWQGSQLLSRLGVSMAFCGPALANKLGITVCDASAGDQKESADTETGVKLLHPVAGIHVALKARQQQRASLFQLRDRRGLSAADDLAFRRQLNGLPANKPGYQFNQAADPGLFHQAVQMLLAK